ncbi:fimbrial protein [Photobacterium profundum]|uniref:fimbrial protein n=1 Tax=Photobacterium profundum TaxID=74109 RepID=UPI003D138D0D
MNIIKLLYVLLIFGSCNVFALKLHECGPINGTTVYNLKYEDGVDDSVNQPGGIVKKFFTFGSNADRVPRKCRCVSDDRSARDDITWYTTTYFTATSPLSKYTSANIQYLDLNESLSIASYYFIGTINKYYTVPFNDKKNTYDERCVEGWMNNPSANTGAKGKIDLRFKKTVIGATHFNGKVSSLYASLKKNVSSTTPIAETYLDITVKTPALCTIREGSNISVDLGTVASAEMNKGAVPNGYTKRDVNLTFDCNFDGSLDLTLMGKASTLTEFYASSNSEVGIAIERSGKLIKPNQSGNQVPLDSHRVGHFDAKAYPVKTISGSPMPGDYSGSVNVFVDVL